MIGYDGGQLLCDLQCRACPALRIEGCLMSGGTVPFAALNANCMALRVLLQHLIPTGIWRNNIILDYTKKKSALKFPKYRGETAH